MYASLPCALPALLFSVAAWVLLTTDDPLMFSKAGAEGSNIPRAPSGGG